MSEGFPKCQLTGRIEKEENEVPNKYEFPNNYTFSLSNQSYLIPYQFTFCSS